MPELRQNIATKENDYDDSVVIALTEFNTMYYPEGCYLWRHVSGDWKLYEGMTGNLLYMGDRRGNYIKCEYDSFTRFHA